MYHNIAMKKLFVLLSSIFLIAQTNVFANNNDEKPYYLFAYFTDNSTYGQQVHYAVSENGIDFTPLNNGMPVIASDTIHGSP